jgi:hypothetical protein
LEKTHRDWRPEGYDVFVYLVADFNRQTRMERSFDGWIMSFMLRSKPELIMYCSIDWLSSCEIFSSCSVSLP